MMLYASLLCLEILENEAKRSYRPTIELNLCIADRRHMRVTDIAVQVLML